MWLILLSLQGRNELESPRWYHTAMTLARSPPVRHFKSLTAVDGTLETEAEGGLGIYMVGSE